MNKLLTALAVVIIGIGSSLLCALLVGSIVAISIMFVAQGLFHYDLSQNFWELVVFYYLYILVFKTNINVSNKG